MTWVSLLATLLGLLASFVSYLKDRKLVDGAVAEIISANLKASIDEIQRANKVRQAVRDAIAARPDSVRDPDPNSRT